MAYFVIGGIIDCPNATHALYMAEYLEKNLNQFSFRHVLKPEAEWKMWLEQVNSENKWQQTTSPLIWKEINRRGGKKYLIGGLGEFWEYCYDYYGLESRITQEDLLKIMADNRLIRNRHKQVHKKAINVCIYGANNEPMMELLVLELQDCLDLNEKLLNIALYDKRSDDPDIVDSLLETTEDLTLVLKSGSQKIFVVSSIVDALNDCDLFIIIEDYSKTDDEDVEMWLNRCKNEMVGLAEDVNRYAKRSLKIVVSHHGPVCFNASVLVEYCHMLKWSNIVAVTADHGIALLSVAAEKTGELIENFGCPPVWGFCGIFSHVTAELAVVTADVYRPNRRALSARKSKLPKGTVEREIRLLGNLIRVDKTFFEEVEARQARQEELLGRKPILAKLRATGALIKIWFADAIMHDVISLGICSDGSFGFSPGVVFSQPVMLNERRMFEPVTNVPIYWRTKLKLSGMIHECLDIINKYKLGTREVPVSTSAAATQMMTYL